MSTKEYSREVYYWRKAHKICVRCGHEDALEDGALCLVCKMENREKASERYHNLLPDEKRKLLDERKEEKKRIRAEKKAQGLCYQCSRPVYKNHAYCYEHYISQKKAHTQNNNAKCKHHPSGTCYICGKEPAPGHKLCPEHYEERAERARKMNAQKNRSSHKWIEDNKVVFKGGSYD